MLLLHSVHLTLKGSHISYDPACKFFILDTDGMPYSTVIMTRLSRAYTWLGSIFKALNAGWILYRKERESNNNKTGQKIVQYYDVVRDLTNCVMTL